MAKTAAERMRESRRRQQLEQGLVRTIDTLVPAKHKAQADEWIKAISIYFMGVDKDDDKHA